MRPNISLIQFVTNDHSLMQKSDFYMRSKKITVFKDLLMKV